MVASPQKTANCQTGFTLVEALIVVALMGVIFALTIHPLRNQKKETKWGRLAGDYVQQLAAVYGKSQLQYGDGPLTAMKCDSSTTCVLEPAFDDGDLRGISALLADWETTVTYIDVSPRHLIYPAGIVVYLQPDDANIPNSGELASGQITYAGDEDDIAGELASDWQWLLLDMNGADLPNSTQPEGDRVLLFIEEETGRILTGWQFCIDRDGSEITPNELCRVNDGSTDYDFYRSFYDVHKNYVFP